MQFGVRCDMNQSMPQLSHESPCIVQDGATVLIDESNQTGPSTQLFVPKNIREERVQRAVDAQGK